MPTKKHRGSDEEDWMEPLEAVHLLANQFGGDRKAKKAITERLRDGAIQSTAWWLAIGADVGLRPYIEPAIVSPINQQKTPTKLSWLEIEEIRRIKTRPTVSHTRVGDGLAFEVLVSSTDNKLMIGRQFWTSARKEDEGRWDWAQGFFIESGVRGGWSSTESKKRISQNIPMRSFALGVRFRRLDIERLLGAPPPAISVAQVAMPVPGERHSKLWANWVAELVCLVHEGVTFSSGNNIVDRVADRLADEGLSHPSKNTVRQAAMATYAALTRSDPNY